ncbi:MAG: agmatinase family protein [Oligoflexia bacterium]|nr:agmatinase family protein [Oligoflexia bacterium]
MGARKTKAFELETSFESADLILIPAPWSATVSYGRGTEQGPDLIRKASHQLDVFNPLFQCSYNDKIHFEENDPIIESLNKQALSWVKSLREDKQNSQSLYTNINQASESLLDWVYEKALQAFNQNKIPALVGGEHSVSEGLLSLIGDKYKGDYGILHLDAHADLRPAYQGFKHSHASVMFNVLNLEQAPKKLVQVAVRDLCESEYRKIEKDERIHCYFDKEIYTKIFLGEKWAGICQEIISQLPQHIYVSLDVDGLSWSYAPGTGTPVPGGLSFNQVLYLLAEIKRQNKKLISFDVVETSAGNKNQSFLEWNGNVSARLIYYLSGLTLHSYGKI